MDSFSHCLCLSAPLPHVRRAMSLDGALMTSNGSRSSPAVSLKIAPATEPCASCRIDQRRDEPVRLRSESSSPASHHAAPSVQSIVLTALEEANPSPEKPYCPASIDLQAYYAREYRLFIRTALSMSDCLFTPADTRVGETNFFFF